jgi:flagellar basal body-associated protein FliL
MADEDEDASAHEPKKATKSKKPILLILVVVVLVGAAAAAGVFLAPALTGGEHPAAAANASAKEHGEEGSKEEHPEEIPASLSVDPIVVDVRDEQDTLHHIKVTLAFELKPGTPDGEFRPLVPRGREAAIAYLRAQTFESLTAADRFEAVKGELTKRVLAAVGEKKSSRVVITDFVAQ